MASERKIHYFIERGTQIGPACSPPWVDEEGRPTCALTKVPDWVTCAGCKRTKRYRLDAKRRAGHAR